MGLDRFHSLVEEREKNFLYLKEKLGLISQQFGLHVMDTPHNPVSLALTLVPSTDQQSITGIGSQLFHRSISGAR